MDALSDSTNRLTCGNYTPHQVYGGGAWIEGGTSTTVITESAPSGDLTGWYVSVDNADPFHNYTVHIYALCGPAGLDHVTVG